jgi:diphthamide synthase (EF-2-diphthine--ammonia ligase)
VTLEPGEPDGPVEPVAPSGLGPMGDVQLLATMLRADRADVESYARVLSGALADALPPGMVEVEYRRSLADRMAGRVGRAVSMVVHGADRQLELREGRRGGVEAELRQVVRGVVISRRSVGLDQWLHALAEDLSRIAGRDATARRALERLLHPGS